MARGNQSEDKTTIMFEEKVGSRWVSKKFSLRNTVNIGSVLREMRAQSDVLRNIQYTKA